MGNRPIADGAPLDLGAVAWWPYVDSGTGYHMQSWVWKLGADRWFASYGRTDGYMATTHLAEFPTQVEAERRAGRWARQHATEPPLNPVRP